MFCVGCGQALNVSATEVRRSVQSELNIERWAKMEVSIRNVLAFVIVIAVATRFAANTTEVLPELDFHPSVPLPDPPSADPPILNFDEEGVTPLPSLEPPQYIRPDASAARKTVHGLYSKVYSMNNVTLHLKKPTLGKRVGRLIDGPEPDKYFYLINAISRFEVEKSNVIKVERVED